jgi:hypothetical protein
MRQITKYLRLNRFGVFGVCCNLTGHRVFHLLRCDGKAVFCIFVTALIIPNGWVWVSAQGKFSQRLTTPEIKRLLRFQF